MNSNFLEKMRARLLESRFGANRTQTGSFSKNLLRDVVRLAILVTCVSPIVSGCVTKVFESPFVARKNAKLDEGLSSANTTLMPLSVGEACKHYVTFLGGWSEGELQDAFEDSLKDQPKAIGLANMQVDEEILFTFFYNRRCKQISGQPVIPLELKKEKLR